MSLTFPAPQVAVAKPWPIEWPYREGPGGLVLLKARVNGRTTHELMLDTGAPVTVLFDGPRTASLGFDTSKARHLGDPRESASPVGVIVRDNVLAFEGVELRGLSMVVIPRHTLGSAERFEAVGFDGGIGADLFNRYVVEIDGAAKVVRLHDPLAWKPPAGAATIPFVIRDRHPFLQVRLQLPGGVVENADLHFDTGQNRGITLNAGADPLIEYPLDGKPTRVWGVSAAREAHLGPPAALFVGSTRLLDPAPTYFPRGAALGGHRHGSVGITLFQGRRIAIDYTSRRLVLLDTGDGPESR